MSKRFKISSHFHIKSPNYKLLWKYQMQYEPPVIFYRNKINNKLLTFCSTRTLFFTFSSSVFLFLTLLLIALKLTFMLFFNCYSLKYISNHRIFCKWRISVRKVNKLSPISTMKLDRIANSKCISYAVLY